MKRLTLGDKSYSFPTRYSDVTTAQAVFRCDFGVAREILAPLGLRPLRTGLRTAALVVSSYRYAEVSGMAPYDEVAVTLPARGRRRAHVIWMPVSSEENRLRGNLIWGLPKETLPISFREAGGDWITTVGDGALEMRVPMRGWKKRIAQEVELVSRLDGRTLVSPAHSAGEYRLMPGFRRSLAIGDARIRRLNIRPRPIFTQFGTGTRSTFDLPYSLGDRAKKLSAP